MNQPPLNPDAIEHAIKEVYGDGPRMDWPSDMTGYQTHRDYARTIVEQIASAYLAVAQPVVNSVEELDKLPVGSVFMDSDKDWAYQIISNGEPGREGRVIVGAGLEEDFGADELTFPLTVLGRPEVKP